jgi:hypothetical protein
MPHKIGRIAFLLVLLFAAIYLAVSYGGMPAFWRLYARHHPALEAADTRALTAQGILGDPINVAFVGSEEDLQVAILTAGWHPSDPITMKSTLRIAAASVLHRDYETAPISALFVWKKKQDLAFQQPVGNDPRRRHHVRFWRSDQLDGDGHPLWLGAATFDTKVGLSHLTGQITHHIDANVDTERNKLVSDLQKSPNFVVEWIDGFQKELSGKNGGGDSFFTDGRLALFKIQK